MSERDEFPRLSPEQLAALSPDEEADYLQKLAIHSGNRYAGKPDLLLKEHPHRGEGASCSHRL